MAAPRANVAEVAGEDKIARWMNKHAQIEDVLGRMRQAVLQQLRCEKPKCPTMGALFREQTRLGSEDNNSSAREVLTMTVDSSVADNLAIWC